MRKSVVCTLGADPEFFLMDASTGRVVSAVGKIGGTKGKPVKISEALTKKGFGVQEDNVMVEFNIPPAKSSDVFQLSIQEAMQALKERIKNTVGSFIVPHVVPCAEFPNKELDSEQAQQFGCSPDFNAHRKGEEFTRISPDVLRTTKGAWRFAGGHIHMGYDLAIPPFVVASFADLFLGLPSLRYDKQKERRKFYGQAGRYRPTPYGIEYRTLSNYWLTMPQYCYSIATQAEQMIYWLAKRTVSEIRAAYSSVPWVNVQQVINEENAAHSDELYSFCMSEIGYDVMNGI